MRWSPLFSKSAALGLILAKHYCLKAIPILMADRIVENWGYRVVTPDQDFFFIIDEINRGNLSKIFGELMQLIEVDYRGQPISLTYENKPFAVPKNLYIIGMMNTADRSLAMIDYALRRRFSLLNIEPGFNSEGFTNYQNLLGNQVFDNSTLAVRKN